MALELETVLREKESECNYLKKLLTDADMENRRLKEINSLLVDKILELKHISMEV